MENSPQRKAQHTLQASTSPPTSNKREDKSAIARSSTRSLDLSTVKSTWICMHGSKGSPKNWSLRWLKRCSWPWTWSHLRKPSQRTCLEAISASSMWRWRSSGTQWLCFWMNLLQEWTLKSANLCEKSSTCSPWKDLPSSSPRTPWKSQKRLVTVSPSKSIGLSAALAHRSTSKASSAKDSSSKSKSSCPQLKKLKDLCSKSTTTLSPTDVCRM